jgi:hypothetical protein
MRLVSATNRALGGPAAAGEFARPLNAGATERVRRYPAQREETTTRAEIFGSGFSALFLWSKDSGKNLRGPVPSIRRKGQQTKTKVMRAALMRWFYIVVK